MDKLQNQLWWRTDVVPGIVPSSEYIYQLCTCVARVIMVSHIQHESDYRHLIVWKIGEFILKDFCFLYKKIQLQ